MTGDGLGKYVFGPNIILKLSSFDEVVLKIDEKTEEIRGRGNDIRGFYYRNGRLWLEVQLLFMCQFVEFRIAEFISSLYRKNLVKIEYIDELLKNKKIDNERKSSRHRLISPKVLLGLLPYTLGMLKDVLRDKTLDFRGKSKLCRNVNDFNGYRIDFIHKSFSNDFDLNKTHREGIRIGWEILSFIENYK